MEQLGQVRCQVVFCLEFCVALLHATNFYFPRTHAKGYFDSQEHYWLVTLFYKLFKGILKILVVESLVKTKITPPFANQFFDWTHVKITV
jgi:hypothetical protein